MYKNKEDEKKWRENNKEYFRNWDRQNREKRRASVRKWRLKNLAIVTAQSIAWHKKHPWVIAYNSAKNRCTNPKIHNYHRYGGRGIEFHLTREEVKFIWFRDKAEAMKTPTMDRIDNDGHYELKNCQFIEMVENIRKSNRLRRLP